MNSAAIVLGGGLKKVTANNTTCLYPLKQVIVRLDKALLMLKNRETDFIITTGRYSKRSKTEHSVSGPKTEAEVGKLYLSNKGREIGMSFVKKRLLFENKSLDTLGNAWYAKKICLEPNDIQEVYIITSDFHIERSELIFRWVLGSSYKLHMVSLNTYFKGKGKRESLERVFIDYFKKWLIPYIKAGDDEKIYNYIMTEHLIYSMSKRSEALFNACLETASIKAAY